MLVREGSTRNVSDNSLKVAMNTNDQSEECASFDYGFCNQSLILMQKDPTKSKTFTPSKCQNIFKRTEISEFSFHC